MYRIVFERGSDIDGIIDVHVAVAVDVEFDVNVDVDVDIDVDVVMMELGPMTCRTGDETVLLNFMLKKKIQQKNQHKIQQMLKKCKKPRENKHIS